MFFETTNSKYEIDKTLLKQNEIEVNEQHHRFLKYLFFLTGVGCFFVLLIDDPEYMKLNIWTSFFLWISFLTIDMADKRVPKYSWKYKYALIGWLYIPLTVMCILSTDYFWLGLAIPIIMSCRYYSTKLVIAASLFTQLTLVVSGLGVAYIQPLLGYARSGAIVLPEGMTFVGKGESMNELAGEMLNQGILNKNEYFKQLYSHHLIYFAMLFVAITVICVLITKQELRILERQTATLMEEKKKELELADSRYKITLSQIQPHFIFNVLNSVYELCEMDPEMAKDMILSFSKYLRHDIDALSNGDPIPFTKELESVEQYLKLERMRFGDRLRISLDIDSDEFLILPLTLQPLVENAVRHGICKNPGGGTVKISTWEEETEYTILIEDDGIGFNTEIKKQDDKEHVGISNVKARVEEQMKGKFTLESEPGKGTRITIAIPKEKVA